jgi:hypothetical protein
VNSRRDVSPQLPTELGHHKGPASDTSECPARLRHDEIDRQISEVPLNPIARPDQVAHETSLNQGAES